MPGASRQVWSGTKCQPILSGVARPGATERGSQPAHEDLCRCGIAFRVRLRGRALSIYCAINEHGASRATSKLSGRVALQRASHRVRGGRCLPNRADDGSRVWSRYRGRCPCPGLRSRCGRCGTSRSERLRPVLQRGRASTDLCNAIGIRVLVIGCPVHMPFRCVHRPPWLQ